MPATAGYSSTPVAKKLGIKEGFIVSLLHPPKNYFSLFADWPANVVITEDATAEKDFIHFFVTEAETLFEQLPLLKTGIKPAGMIWVSWPKKAAKVKTDISEDVIRDVALRIGLVDVKVCAVDEVWSGLKLMIPVKLRE